MGKKFRIGMEYQAWIPEGGPKPDAKAVQAWDPVVHATERVSVLCARWRIIYIRTTLLDLEWKRWWQKALERVEARIRTYCITFGMEIPNFVTMADAAGKSKKERAEANRLDRQVWCEEYEQELLAVQSELVCLADEALKDRGTPELRRGSNRLMHQLSQEMFHVKALRRNTSKPSTKPGWQPINQ